MANSSNWAAIPRFDFSGGINTRFSKIGLAENEVVDMYNVHITPRGGVSKRSGIRAAPTFESADNEEVNGLYYFQTEDVSLLMRTKGGNIEYLQAYGWVDVTNGHTISNDADVLMVWDTFRNNCVLTDGINPLLKWDGDASGSGFAALGNAIDGGADTIDSAKAVVNHRGRLVLGNVKLTESSTQTHYESRIISSDTGTLDSWDSAKTGWSIDIGEGDGHAITALVDIDGVLIVFKEGSLWKVTNLGREGIQDTEFIAEVGTLGPHSVKAVGTIVFFLDPQGHLWAYNSRGVDENSLQNLSVSKLGPSVIDQVVKNRLPQASMYYDPYWAEIVYGVSMPGTATQTTTWWTYNLLSQGFARLEYPNGHLNLVVNVKDKDDVTRAVGGGYDGLVYQLEYGDNDSGNDIEGFIITRADDFGDLSVEKILGQIIVWARVNTTKTFNIESRTDFSQTGIEYDEQITPPGDDYSGSPLWGTPSGDTSSNAASPVADDDEPTVVPDGATKNDAVEVLGSSATIDFAALAVDDQGFVLVGAENGTSQTVKKMDPLSLAEEWSTEVINSANTDARIRGIAFCEATGKVLAWNNLELYVLSRTGTIEQTVDIPTSYDSQLTDPVDNMGPNGIEVSGNILISLKDNGAGNTHNLLEVSGTDGSYVAHKESLNGSGASKIRRVGNKIYWVDAGLVNRCDDSSPFAQDGDGQGGFLESDHGNLGSSGYGVGTAISSTSTMAYDSDGGRLVAMSGTSEWYIISTSSATHPDGTPHSPAHSYLPSNNDPGEAWNFGLTAAPLIEYHVAQDCVYIFGADATGQAVVKAESSTSPGTSPTQLDKDNTSFGSAAGQPDYSVYNPVRKVMHFTTKDVLYTVW